MNSLKKIAEMTALRDIAVEDLLATSDEDLRQEALEDGVDMDALAVRMDFVMQEAAATARRQRLALAKERMKPNLVSRVAPITRPSLDQIKQIIQGVFRADPSLGLAFREGKKQTDADWLSLYDDLVAMGAVKPDGHGD